MGRFAKNPIIGDNASGITIPNVTTAQRPSGTNGQLVYNTTTATYQVYKGSGWYNVSESSREKSITVDRFQGDGSTTVFGGSSGGTLGSTDNTSAVLSVVPDSATDMIIFVGGIYQAPITNYTYTGGQITFGSVPPANDGSTSGHVITIIHNLQKLGA